jgi:hypothetical protein
MIVRHLKPSDIPILNAMAKASGYPYPDLDSQLIEAVLVVADAETDQPLMACAAQRILEMYLYSGTFRRPLAKLHAIKLIHEAMPEMLRARGYNEANAFLPPGICVKFKSRLSKMFGWSENWASVARRF